MLSPKYDEHQFETRARMVSQETCLSFQDIRTMHVESRTPAVKRRAGGPPLWSQNDADLRRVVLAFCARYVGFRKPLSGTDAERLQAIRDKAKAMLPDKEKELKIVLAQYHQLKTTGKNSHRTKDDGKRDWAIMVQNRDTQVQVLRRGLPELAMAVAVYSYRLGWDSSKVAQELRLHPPGVREWLYRMNRAANGTKKTSNRHRKPCVPWPADMVWKLFQMRVMGYDLKECAKVFGVGSFTLAHRWRQAFGNLTVKTIKAKALKAKPRAGKWDAERLRAFFALRTSGLSFVECAKRLGTATSYAIKIWRKNFGDLKLSVRRAA